MALIYSGFSTRINFDNEDMICTSYGVSENASSLESGSGYGGKLESLTDMAIGSPYVLDFGEVTGNFAVQPTKEHVSNFLTWVKTERNAKRALKLYTGKTSTITYDECYFNSMGFSASEGDVVSTDVGLYIVSKAFDSGKKVGGEANETGNFDVSDYALIPYWQTSLDMFDDVISWNLNFSQSVTPRFYCKGEFSSVDEPPEPDFVLIGLLNVELSFSLMVAKEVLEYSEAFSDFTEDCKVDMAGSSITLKKLVSDSLSPSVTDAGSYATVDLSYKAHELES